MTETTLSTKKGEYFTYKTRYIKVPTSKSIYNFNKSIGLAFLKPLEEATTIEEIVNITLGFIKRDLMLSVMAGNITPDEAKQNYEKFLKSPLNSKIWANRGTFDERKLIESAQCKDGYLLEQTEENIEKELQGFVNILTESNNPETMCLFEQLGDLPLFASIYIDKDAAHSVVPRVPIDIMNKVNGCAIACDEVDKFYRTNNIQIPGLQVIEIDDKIVGFGGWTLYVNNEHPNLIETNLAFLKQYRSNGYGNAIFNYFAKNAVEQINKKGIDKKQIELYTDCKQENFRSFLAANAGSFYPIKVTEWARDKNIKVIQMKFDVEKYLENPSEYPKVVKQQTAEFMKQNPNIEQFFLKNTLRNFTNSVKEFPEEKTVDLNI